MFGDGYNKIPKLREEALSFIKNKIIIMKRFFLVRSILSLALAVPVTFISFAAAEPAVSNAVTDAFTVTQTITSEISFSTTAGDVTMDGSIAGVSGGTSVGATQFAITTNDSAGYNVTIQADSNPALAGDTQGDDIANYTEVSAGVPDYTYSVPTGEEFAYTVSASTTADLDQSFKDNGSTTCGTGSADTTGEDTCWLGFDALNAETIINRTSEAPTGATSTIYFQVTVNAGSTLVEDTYTADVTLTAVTN